MSSVRVDFQYGMISMVVQMANAKSQMEMANAMKSLFDITDAILQRGAASWDQERSHQITHPPSVGPCLLCLAMFQTRNIGLNTVMAYNDITRILH